MTKDEMKNVGELFKQRRKEMNISLKEAENATSIRTTYLQAIEEGEMQKLISPVYAHGFMKQYATFLGVDGDKIAKDHPDFFNPNRGQTQEFSYGIGTLEVRGNPGAGIKWVPNAMWIGALLLIFISAWFFAKFFEVV